jgi:phage-related minor tail protein
MKRAFLITALLVLLMAMRALAMPTGMTPSGTGGRNSSKNYNSTNNNNSSEADGGMCGNNSKPKPTDSVVPEPTTITLLGIGALGLGMLRRNRK